MTLKKALVAITVVAMLFGMVSTSFAGGFSDITDTKIAAAATRLNGLSIMKGFPDGSFGADQTITRAQFAAVAVRALGLDSAATYAKGITKFSDVAADHWASGYVNIASQQGIIAGFPDGTFHPEEAVNYAQALTIITRMLGYGPVTEGKGTWPSNYIVRAAMIGFSNGVSFSAMDPAKRGDIALFTDSALTKSMMVETGVIAGQPSYGIDDTKTLLGTNLGVSSQTGTLTSSPEIFGAAADKVTVVDGDVDTTDVFTLNGASYAGLYGHTVKAWYNSNGVVLIEDKTAADSVKSATYTSATSVTIGTDVVDLTGISTLRNGQVVTDSFAAGDSIKVIYNTATPAVPVYATATGYTLKIASANNTSFSYLSWVGGGTFAYKDAVASVTGAATKLADVKADDVVEFYTATVDTKTYVTAIVTRNAKSGTLTKADSVNSKLYVDGVAYGLTNSVTVAANLSLLGEKVDVILNKDGKIAAIAAQSAAEATEQTALIRGTANVVPTMDGSTTYLPIFKADGTKATLALAADAAFAGADGKNYTVNTDGTLVATDGGLLATLNAGIAAEDVITYTVDSDGKIDSIAVDTTTALVADADVDATNHLVGTVFVPASTVIFDLRTSTWAVMTRDQVEAQLGSIDATSIVSATGNVANFVVINAATAKVGTSTAKTGFIVGAYQTADAKFATISVAGVASDYKVGDADYTFAVANTDAVITFNAVGTDADTLAAVTGLLNAAVGGSTWKVKAIDLTNGTVTIARYDDVTFVEVPSSAVVYAAGNAQVFDLTGDSTAYLPLAGLTVGAKVQVYGTSPVAKVIEIVE